MKALEEKIVREGAVLPGDVLKVGSFLNQQLDVAFLSEMGREIARLFREDKVDRILTIEASGIAIAFAAAVPLGVPVVIAKKSKAANQSGEMLSVEITSYTHKNTYFATVGADYLPRGSRVLIVDDFLARGNALIGLTEMLDRAGDSAADEERGTDRDARLSDLALVLAVAEVDRRAASADGAAEDSREVVEELEVLL